MTWIKASGEKSVTINAPLEKVFNFLADIAASSPLFPGVERIEKQSEDTFRWVLAEKSTAGMKFRGDYSAKYTNNGKDEVNWTYVSGNVKMQGGYKIVQSGSAVTVTLTNVTESDAPVPSLMTAIAKPFAQSELNKGMEGFMAAIKKHLEA